MTMPIEKFSALGGSHTYSRSKAQRHRLHTPNMTGCASHVHSHNTYASPSATLSEYGRYRGQGMLAPPFSGWPVTPMQPHERGKNKRDSELTGIKVLFHKLYHYHHQQPPPPPLMQILTSRVKLA